jgi:hypothetical protein
MLDEDFVLQHPEQNTSKPTGFPPTLSQFLTNPPGQQSARVPLQQGEDGSSKIIHAGIDLLLLLVAILPKALLALVRGDLLTLAFPAVRHENTPFLLNVIRWMDPGP